MAEGAPLTLATYGTGFQTHYWRSVAGQSYATLPVWTLSEVETRPSDGASTRTRGIEEILFYFPPTSAYVRPAPERILIESRGQPGRDLELLAVHQTLFAPARRGDPGAVLNPGLFAGDANAQIALAAAEINAQAGRRLLSLKLGVDNLAVDGSLVNDRMRFGILSALAQARVANSRYPGTVTHLIVSNEYARPAAASSGGQTPTQQVTEMIRYAKAQMAPGADFAGLDLKVGVRGNSFLAVDPASKDPSARRFARDVAGLVSVADFLMENRYPSAEAVAAASRSGHWRLYFAPENGELSRQWERLTQAIRALPGGGGIELMIGEIGQPTNGISFNLPGYVEDIAAIRPDSPFAELERTLDVGGGRIGPDGVRIFQRHFNDASATAFVREALAWSRAKGVQIHLFEAFDEPQKSVQGLPPGAQDRRARLLNRSGPYGAEAFFGLFGYTGVAAFHARQATDGAPRAGAALTDGLPPGIDWAPQFEGRFYPKLAHFDFAAAARAFKAVISP